MGRNIRTDRAKPSAKVAGSQETGKKRPKVKMPKTASGRPGDQTSRPADGTAKKNESEAVRRIDQAVQEFEAAADGLQTSVERLRGTLPELVAIEVRRDRLRLIRTLADDGILDSLQRLAKALEDLGPEKLPKLLVPLHRSARIAIDRICRTFEVQAVYQPGESLAVTQEQVKDFDWSVDPTVELNFPVQVEILQSGWKTGDAAFVLPRVRVGQGPPID